ncbi:hypothetical protein TcYC6_0000970 [Trypanosoma cruzi]|nr:hypothetical protein TcYC6_0000970 [Trypanosoma cruzi]
MPVEPRHNVGTSATTTTTTDSSSGIATAAVFTSPPDANEQLALLASLRFGRQRVHAWLHNTEKMLQQTADAKWMCAWITSA